MPAITMSVCSVCGNTFTINLNECKIVNNMKVKNSGQNDGEIPIKTWGDWILHIQSHCPEHRYPAPPISAMENLEQCISKITKE